MEQGHHTTSSNYTLADIEARWQNTIRTAASLFINGNSFTLRHVGRSLEMKNKTFFVFIIVSLQDVYKTDVSEVRSRCNYR